MKVITARDVPALIPDGATIAVEGFIGSGVADEIHYEMGEAFQRTGHPNNLTLIHAGGIGDGAERGMNYYAHEGMLKRVIGGHWGMAPKLQPLVQNNQMEAYNLPQGVITHLMREAASKKPIYLSRVGVGTFVDPDFGGGKLNERSTEDIIHKTEIKGEPYLVYDVPEVNVAILRGTYADERGNIAFDDEPLTLEATAEAMAAHNHGGIVIVQVKKIVKNGELNPKLVKIPGLLVDYVVEATSEDYHGQTYQTMHNDQFIQSGEIHHDMDEILPLNQRKVIARRCAMAIPEGAKIINYGIGMPEMVAQVLKEEGVANRYTPTVEPGTFGGAPQSGLDFGAAIYPEATIDQPYMFDFYDGGGIDVTFLGLAECDQNGNINVSKFGPKIAGAGGFINISQNTEHVVFCGAFTAKGLKTEVKDGQLHILQEGSQPKFVSEVEQITFSAQNAKHRKQHIYYVTERAVFELRDEGLTLIEIAPGIDLEKDIKAQMQFEPLIASDLKQMDARIFEETLMHL